MATGEDRKMRLHHWKSRALQDWKEGDIIVMAPNVELARAIARQMFPEWFNKKYRHDWEWMNPSGEESEHDREQYQTKLAEFEADLAVEPIFQYPFGGILVDGSS